VTFAFRAHRRLGGLPEVSPPPSPGNTGSETASRNVWWNGWRKDAPTPVGIAHGFSSAVLFRGARAVAGLGALPRRFPAALADRRGSHLGRVHPRRHPRQRRGAHGQFCWRRLTKERASGAKSVFHFGTSSACHRLPFSKGKEPIERQGIVMRRAC